MIPTIFECLKVAADVLTPEDIPAVVYLDTESARIIAEPVARFALRPDCDRYAILLRICEDIITAAQATPNNRIVDIRPSSEFADVLPQVPSG